MSKLNEIPFLEPSNAEHLPVPAQNDSASMVEWTTFPVNPEAEAKEGFNATTILHSVRRHWLLSAVLGVIVGTVITTTCVLFLPKTYTAHSLIKVDMRPEENPIGTTRYYNPGDYEVFKNSQALSIRSPFVLNKALRDDAVTRTSVYKREEENPVRWLQDHLVISYPNKAEFMEVSLSDANPDEVATIVNAVVDAYKTDVVELAKQKKRRDLLDLENLFREKKDEAKTKRNALKEHAKRTNTLDRPTLSVQQQAIAAHHGDLRRTQMMLEQKCLKANRELAAVEAKMSTLLEKKISKHELSEAIAKDPLARSYQMKMAQWKDIVSEQEAVSRSTSADDPFSKQFTRGYQTAKENFEEREAELKEQLFESKKQELQAQVDDKKLNKEMLDEEKKLIDKEYDKSEKDFEQLGKYSVEIEIMQAELRSLDSIIARLNTQYEQAKYELKHDSRITVPQKAESPKSHDAPQLRISMAVIAGIFGAILPLFLIVVVDIQKRRINGPEDVKKKIGLPVMGAVPVIPSRAIRQLGAPKGAGYHWNMRLTESVDGIRARLLRNSLHKNESVVLITSAVSGEGKTTLAVQIAMSLARAGKRTVLVDFDLRRPAIDKAFQLPLDPGISEALCGESDVRELVRPVGIDNLDVITTGRCDRLVLQALANGEDARVLSQLKKEYDFVIVDGSPILPVADARYIAQHVDSVVMSVFRDLSRAPKVLAAYNILKSFDVENIEAVIASPCDAGYGVVHSVLDNKQAAGTA